jgi:hypothetical protein
MDESIESKLVRLKRMKKFGLIREETRERRNQTINKIRKEKRLNIVNSFRGLDFDWFYVDISDDSDTEISQTSKSMHQLVDYIMGSIDINENIARDCIGKAKKLLKDNRHNCQDLTRVEFFQRLSAIVANPLISSTLKVSILDLIESMMSCLDINLNLLLKSGIVLSIMISLNTFDIELITKTITVMQIITNFSNEMLTIALENGYLLFLMNIIQSTQLTKQKNNNKLNQYIHSFKLDLIRAISQSLLNLALRSTNADVINTLFPLFERLILFKDPKVISNIVTALVFITEKNPNYLFQNNSQIIVIITEFLTQNNENIVLNALRIWIIIIINATQCSSLVTDTKLMRNVRILLENNSNLHVIKEILNFLFIFMEKYSIAIDLMIKWEIIPLLIRALSSVDYFCKQQILFILKLIIKTESHENLIYLIRICIIETLVSLLVLEEENLTFYALEAYHCILSSALKLGQLDCVITKASQCSLNERIIALENHQNDSISSKAFNIRKNFLSNKPLNSCNSELRHSFQAISDHFVI